MEICRRRCTHKTCTQKVSWNRKMTKSAQQKMWWKIYPTITLNHLHIYRPWWRNLQHFRMVHENMQEELRTQGIYSKCLLLQKKDQLRKAIIWHNLLVTCTSTDHDNGECKVSKWYMYTCRRSCAHKVRALKVFWYWKILISIANQKKKEEEEVVKVI